MTWTLGTQNAAKIINSFKSSGRKVDEHIAWIIFRNVFENKPCPAQYMDEVCDKYRAALWNMGAIIE